MKKIPSLFIRERSGPGIQTLVENKVTPGCEWVIAGEGICTRKWDGTACLVKDGKLYKRYDAKHGKTPPDGFIPAQEPDEKTGHWPGWLLVTGKPDEKWHLEPQLPELNATYELCGPKINGNPERLERHEFKWHGDIVIRVGRTFEDIREFLRENDMEGIVFHHPDGRMCKVKKSDFGFKRAKA